MVLTSWAASILLASIFPFFNFKDEFIEYWTKAKGAPPSRRSLLLNAFGVGSFYFMVEKSNEQRRPNRYSMIFLFSGFASYITAVLFWVTVIFVFVFVTTYI